MSDDPKERRKFARLDIALTVAYSVQNPGGDPSAVIEATSSDISAGGLRLMTPGPLENGSVLDLEIFLGESEEAPLHAVGEVVWQSKIAPTSFETGIFIKHIENEDKKRVMSFVFDQMATLMGLNK